MSEHPETPVSDEVRLRNVDGSWTWIEARARNGLDDPDVEAAWEAFRDSGRERDTFPLARPDGDSYGRAESVTASSVGAPSHRSRNADVPEGY